RGPGAPAGHAERRSASAVHGAVPPAVSPELTEPQPVAAASGQGSQAQPTAVDPASGASAQQPTAADPAAATVTTVAAHVRHPKPAAREPEALPNKPARTNKLSAQPPQELGLAEELRQLEQIRQRLRVSPARALVEADTHARRFPQGTLGPERELLRVDALLRLGRNAEARKLADRMLAAPEGHPYRAQIEKLLTAR
ncbi:MAG TPA: hypothetical protein VMF89_23640, partial [Polyangiales bacterium]|nr:hypothetical protein [Polyangiales bacterium]